MATDDFINNSISSRGVTMNFFKETTMRLKHQLGMQSDKDVAQALGLSPTAFNQRKARNAFPEMELLALIAKRPDLGLDFDYVMLGMHSPGLEDKARDQIRNANSDLPQLSLLDLHAIREALLLAAAETSIGPSRLARHLGVSDAYANQLLLSLCAANLMFINHGASSLDVHFIKAIEKHITEINRLIATAGD